MAQPTADVATVMRMIKASGVSMRTMLTVETAPRRRRVTRSPKHAATGGAMLSIMAFGRVSERRRVAEAVLLPGSKPNRLQSTTSEHMKDPNIALERQAESMAEEAVIMNLRVS